ncbi:hypothetical protein PanWU01x14_002220 [Parasponia andersonii]|uniref:Uncharacterized protein n=1 Tax=Parasponia andersonii TaxID=3476 RepID=A0A2P5E551_PARAD|nr:hypothetical protein PanWU01x14_002220 [Parasponia andersonii]
MIFTRAKLSVLLGSELLSAPDQCVARSAS